MKFGIKRDDIVVIISGKDAGKKGKVLKLFCNNGRAIVEGINLIKKHLRKRREDQQAGIVQMESSVDISNLMLFCKRCNSPKRFKIEILKDGTKSRVCKKCGEAI